MSVRKAASPRSISSQARASETKSRPAPPYRAQLGHALDHGHVQAVLDVVFDRVREDALVHEFAHGVLDQPLLVCEREVHSV